MTAYVHVCKYIYICTGGHIYIYVYIHLNVGSIPYTSGSWDAILLPGTQPADCSPGAAKAPCSSGPWRAGWALLQPMAALLGLLGWACCTARDILQAPRSFRVRPRALEPAVRILAVVKRHAMDTEDVGLQVPLLGGTVRAVSALEGPVTCTNDKRTVRFLSWYSKTRWWNAAPQKAHPLEEIAVSFRWE